MKMQKKQFRIGQLAENLGVERFVIRFWEKEFDFNAHRSDGGQRFYEEKDLDRFRKIKKLLYEEGFTIAGAKKRLKQGNTKIIASQKTTLPAECQHGSITQEAAKELKTIKEKLKLLQKCL